MIRVMCIFLALFAAVPSVPARATGCTAAELRVMTYNIRLDTPADGPNRWELRRDLFIGQLRLLRPSLLGLQEVVPGQRADIAAAMRGYTLLGGGRDDGANAGEASPLLVDKARFRIASSGMFWLSPTPLVPSIGWDAAYRRVATWAHLVDRKTGKRLLAVNTHWDHVGLAARLNSGAQLRDWIAHHRSPGEGVVVLGDFNAPLEEASLVALMASSSEGLELRDARALSREAVAEDATTFNGWNLVPAQAPAIDHILVGHGLAVSRHHVLAEHFGGRLASDHFPVIADLKPAECASKLD